MSVLEAISQNVSIEKLTWDAPFYPSSFATFLTNSQSALRDLNITFGTNIPTSHQQLIASAFGAQNAGNLHSLTLQVDGREDLVVRILTNLRDQVPLMRKLALRGGHINGGNINGDNAVSRLDAVFDALSQYLSSSSSSALERFELGRFELGQSNMAKILSGLKHSASSDTTDGPVISTTTLSVLAFLDNTFDVDSFDELAAFLETETTNDCSGDIVYESHLRELHVEYMESSTLPRRMAERLAASILTAVDESESTSKSRIVALPTVGSLIHTLRLCHAHSSFLRHLRDNADRVWLRELQLVGMSASEARNLSQYLPQQTNLSKLTARKMHRSIRRWILKGLKHNGSIGEFSLVGVSWDWPMTDDHPSYHLPAHEAYDTLNESESRLIDAYGYRNKVLGTLLGNGRYESNAVTATTASRDDEVGRQGSSSNDSGAPRPSRFDQVAPINVDGIHFPLLMKATMDVPRSCLGMVTRGLLKLNEAIGLDGSSSSSGAKRKARDCD